MNKENTSKFWILIQKAEFEINQPKTHQFKQKTRNELEIFEIKSNRLMVHD